MMQEKEFHIEARITFLRAEEGGRTGPCRQGYRPAFHYPDQDREGWDAFYVFDREEIQPGDTVTAHVWFTMPEVHEKRLHVGKEFLLREGAHLVARGLVTQMARSGR